MFEKVRNCLRSSGMQIVNIDACACAMRINKLVFSPPRTFSPMIAVSLEFVQIQK